MEHYKKAEKVNVLKIFICMSKKQCTTDSLFFMHRSSVHLNSIFQEDHFSFIKDKAQRTKQTDGLTNFEKSDAKNF